MRYSKIGEYTALDFMRACVEETRYYNEKDTERKVGAEFTHTIIYPAAFELCDDYKKAQDQAKEVYDALLKFAEKWFVIKEKKYQVNPDPFSHNYILLVGFEMIPKGVCDEL